MTISIYRYQMQKVIWTAAASESHDGRDYQLCTITNAHREKRLLKPLKHLKLSGCIYRHFRYECHEATSEHRSNVL
ncbi:hypothetical protein T07_654 [Trichinella nelsoni]|uniref:Uncharacterized protein n=1 Tax=Trichinella nelsoni TaxID=6336 RepID=A0A0V0RMC9_9BILA|nr:hypothetical protein T07_654 [Trichinella nelsoni]